MSDVSPVLMAGNGLNGGSFPKEWRYLRIQSYGNVERHSRCGEAAREAPETAQGRWRLPRIGTLP